MTADLGVIAEPSKAQLGDKSSDETCEHVTTHVTRTWCGQLRMEDAER